MNIEITLSVITESELRVSPMLAVIEKIFSSDFM